MLLTCVACANHQAAQKALRGSAFHSALAPTVSGDVQAALTALAALPASEHTPKEQAVVACMRSRFGPEAKLPTASTTPAVPAKIAALFIAYQTYWQAVLRHRLAEPVAAAMLLSELNAAMGTQYASMDDAEDEVKVVIEAQGLFALTGTTPPLRELMIWRAQTVGAERVMLDSGEVQARVVVFDDFVSMGWLGYASCDERHTGGWATREQINVVKSGWDFAGEAYRVSLVAHEAQHFSDYTAFPNLAPTDLEYRAKLTELAHSERTTKELLEAFMAEARRDRTLPHPFASYWLIQALRDRLGAESLAARSDALLQGVRIAAREALRAHSAALIAKGAATVESVLPD